MICFWSAMAPVFREIADNARVSVRYKFMINKVWSNLNTAARVIVADSRFPSAEEMQRVVAQNDVDFIGCHLGHQPARHPHRSLPRRTACRLHHGRTGHRVHHVQRWHMGMD